MESNEFKTILLEEIHCGCCFEGTIIAASSNSLIYYQDCIKILPWFVSPDLCLDFLAMNSSFASILTRSGILFLLPLSSMSSDQFLPAWRKFILKSFHAHLSTNTEEGMLDALGSCLAGRDRVVENYLEVSILKVNSSNFTGMVWTSNLLIVSSAHDFFIINTHNAALVKKVTVRYRIEKVDLLDAVLLINAEGGYYVITVSDLVSDKINTAKKVSWDGRVLALHASGVVSVVQSNKLEIFTPEQLVCPSSVYALPREFETGILWGKCILAVGPGVTVLGRTPLVYCKRINKGALSGKICACGECKERRKEVDYEDWIKKDKDSCVLWTTEQDIGKVRYR